MITPENSQATSNPDREAGGCCGPSPCSPIRAAYSREEIEAKLKEWMVAEFGHPRDYMTEPAAKERWYRDYGLMYNFICDHFPVANQRLTKERDKALSDLDFRRGLYKVLEEANNRLTVANDEVREKLKRITEAASAVVDRWEQPAWKDAEPTAAVIYRLRDALGRESK